MPRRTHCATGDTRLISAGATKKRPPVTALLPVSVPDLVDRVREMAEREGTLPSRNRVMREFRVGASKAAQALAQLTADGAADPDSERPEPESVGTPATIAQGTESVHVVGGVDPDLAPVRRAPSWPLVLLAMPRPSSPSGAAGSDSANSPG